MTVRGPKGEISTHALLDEGSTVTLVDSKLAEQVGADGKEEALNLRSMNDDGHQRCKSKRISLEIFGVNGEVHKMVDVRTVTGLDLPAQSVKVEHVRRNWSHLRRINVDDLVGAKPRILIGMDQWDLIITTDVIRGPKDAPAVSKTKLGWVLHGNIGMAQTPVETTLNIWGEEEDTLHQLVKRSFTTEDFGVKLVDQLPKSKEDIQAEIIMAKTTKRIGNRWETGLLWKDEGSRLPESKSMAWRRLRAVEKKMDRDKLYGDQYVAKMEEHFTKGYAHKLRRRRPWRDHTLGIFHILGWKTQINPGNSASSLMPLPRAMV